jgi:hypothetical protein
MEFALQKYKTCRAVRWESMATTVRKSPVFRIDQEEPKVPMVVSVVASKDPVDIRPTVRRC